MRDHSRVLRTHEAIVFDFYIKLIYGIDQLVYKVQRLYSIAKDRLSVRFPYEQAYDPKTDKFSWVKKGTNYRHYKSVRGRLALVLNAVEEQRLNAEHIVDVGSAIVNDDMDKQHDLKVKNAEAFALENTSRRFY